MARKLIKTTDITHEEWLDLRKKSIGGSEAGIIAGMNRYGSLIELYCNKKGITPDKESNEAMRIGNDLEAYVAERFCEKTGKKVRNDNYMYMHDDYDYITANVDRRVVGENAGLECKTMSIRADYDLENGEVPAQYYCQCQHYMGVMGFDKMYLAILVLQRGLYALDVERNDDFINDLIERESEFWNTYIVPGVMPAPDGSESATEVVKNLYPQQEHTEVIDDRIDDMVADYRFLAGEIKRLKEEQDEIKNKICVLLGNNESGRGNNYGCTWKVQSRSTFDSKTLQKDMPAVYTKYTTVTESKVFRTNKVKKAKGE